MKQKKILHYWVRPYKWHIFMAALAGIGCASVNVAVSDLLKRMINMASIHQLNGLSLVIAACLVLMVVGMISNYASVYLTGKIGANLVRDIRKQAIEHLTSTRPDYIEKSGFGDVLARLTQDVDGIRAFAENYLCNCIYVPIMIAVFSIYLCYLQPVLFLSTMIPLLILVIITTKLLTPVKLSQKKYSKMLGNANDNIKETYDGASVVKAFAMEPAVYDKFKSKLEKCLRIGQKNDWLQYRIIPLSNLIYELPIVIAIVVGGAMTFHHKMTIGSLVAFVSLVKILIDPLTVAYQLWVNSKSAMANLERIQKIFEEPAEDSGLEGTSSTNMIQTKLLYQIHNLNFCYQPGDEVLHNISLSIPVGSKTAFVGMSGSGKSSLLKLLYRHYDTYHGSIEFCGRELKTMKACDFRNRIALISQTPYLFPMTIADNIRIGRKNASREEVVLAARKAHCDEFIEKLPDGYDTLVGENGVSLSGGQMQRLTFARAILKNADILLLDEPTSALDQESERLINLTLDEICKNEKVTVVSVAHRLNTIQSYDQIELLDHGKIVESGTHQELIRKGEQYAAFYKAFTV